MEHQSRSERFVQLALQFPGLRILWAICTFGYHFPRVRKGENLTICIIRSFIIGFLRFSCIMGAIWYINNLRSYVSQGDNRPFNILERQEGRSQTGTVVPMLSLFSAVVGKLDLQSVVYSTKNKATPFNVSDSSDWYWNDTTSNGVGDEMLTLNLTMLQDTMFSRTDMESMQVQFKHLSTSLPYYPWIQAGIIHPWTAPGNYSNQDLYNRYFFRPGHYLEIGYTPMRIFAPNQLKDLPSLWGRIKYYMGFGGQNVIYAYQTTGYTSPFPPGLHDEDTIVIIIRPQTELEIISYMVENVTLRDTMSSIGGLIGIVGSAIVFLFGASLMSPWGFIAGLPFFRRRISGSLAKAYDNDLGMSKGPFTTRFEDTGKFDPEIKTTDQRISMLKERIDELEMVLSEYYLDGAIFTDYASERNKLKVARAASISSRATGKTGSESYTRQQNEQSAFQRRWGNTREPLVLPSQTLMESQHQHRGQLPSPQFPPVYARQSQEHTHRQSPEPSALVYYQQQLQKNRQHGKYRSESEQSLLAQLVEDDEEFISPSDVKRYPDQDQQTQGLLQQDHYGMHQTFLEQQERRIHQQERPPAFPPRPPKGNLEPIIVNAPVQASSLLSPSPPLSHVSPIGPENSRSASWRSDGTDKGSKPNIVNSRSIFGSSTYSGHTSTTGTTEYEHMDMSDMSRMVREREI